MEEINKKFNIALNTAKIAEKKGELPVGCCLFINDSLFYKEYNRTNEHSDPLAHCEFLTIKYFLTTNFLNLNIHKCEFYITLEPCAMCYKMIIKLKKKLTMYFPNIKFFVYFGVYNEIFGMTKLFPHYLDTTLHYMCINNYESVFIIKNFYSKSRNIKIIKKNNFN